MKLRRLRQNSTLLNLVSETRFSVDELIYPIFVRHGINQKVPIEPMPGIFQFSVDQLSYEIEELRILGIRSVLLFGIPEEKDSIGKEAFSQSGVIQRAIKEIKRIDPAMLVITDVCLCDYTDHGHCGVLNGDYVDN